MKIEDLKSGMIVMFRPFQSEKSMDGYLIKEKEEIGFRMVGFSFKEDGTLKRYIEMSTDLSNIIEFFEPIGEKKKKKLLQMLAIAEL